MGASVMGANVILGMGNFSAIFWIRGLSNGELWDAVWFSGFVMCISCGKINILTTAMVMIRIIAIKISNIFQKLRRLGGLIGADVGSD